MSQRRLAVDLALAAWILFGSLIYLRQFAGPGLQLLRRLLGR